MVKKRFSQIVSVICILAVAAAMAGIWAGSFCLLIAALAAAVWWRIQLKREKKRLLKEGVQSLIYCECFEGNCDFKKNQGYIGRVYWDHWEFVTEKKELVCRIAKREMEFCKIVGLEEIRNPREGIQTGLLGEEIQRTDQSRKRIMKHGEAKYLIINRGGQVLSFFITPENQQFNQMYCKEWEASASQESLPPSKCYQPVKK